MDFLKYKNFIGSIEYSEPDNILYGKVLGLHRILISYEGQTVDELRQDFIDGIEHYLSVCEEEGIKPQKSYTGAFNVRIPSDMHGRAVLKAQELGINLNAFVKSAIEEKLNLENA
ncbi:MAG: type II toxin-antitoxin system HicB family antitoxin [Flavobacteriaceae bacterium]|jgi:predicted HicB family RNase H-like nuclease|nr:type II toxin-antitoxin system HicB family antitoxin [Flavobacteriaceae bacterium]